MTTNCGKSSYVPLEDFSWLSIEEDALSNTMVLKVAPTSNAEAGTHLVTLEMYLEDYPDNVVAQITFSVQIIETVNQAPVFSAYPFELLTFQ